MKIKITEPGWLGYTGHFGVTEFKDGVSVDDVSQVEINSLSANIRVVAIDGDEVGALARYTANQNTTVATEQEQAAKPSTSAAFVASLIAPSAYTKEALEAVADSKGIAGLREIASSFGVSARSISELIEGILAAQNKAE